MRWYPRVHVVLGLLAFSNVIPRCAGAPVMGTAPAETPGAAGFQGGLTRTTTIPNKPPLTGTTQTKPAAVEKTRPAEPQPAGNNTGLTRSSPINLVHAKTGPIRAPETNPESSDKGICLEQEITAEAWTKYGIGEELVSNAAKTTFDGRNFVEWTHDESWIGKTNEGTQNWLCNSILCDLPDPDAREVCPSNPWAYAAMWSSHNFWNYIWGPQSMDKLLGSSYVNTSLLADSIGQTFNPIEIQQMPFDPRSLIFGIAGGVLGLSSALQTVSGQLGSTVFGLSVLAKKAAIDAGFAREDQVSSLRVTFSKMTTAMRKAMLEFANGVLFDPVDEDPQTYAHDPMKAPTFFSNADGFTFGFSENKPMLPPEDHITAILTSTALNSLWKAQRAVVIHASERSLGFNPCAGNEPKVSNYQYCDTDGSVYVIAKWPNERDMGIGIFGTDSPAGVGELESWGLDVGVIGMSSHNNQIDSYFPKAPTDIDPNSFDPTSKLRLVFSNFPVCELDNLQPFLTGITRGDNPSVWSNPAPSNNDTFWAAARCNCPYQKLQDGSYLPYGFVAVAAKHATPENPFTTLPDGCNTAAVWPRDCKDCNSLDQYGNFKALKAADWPGVTCSGGAPICDKSV